MKRLLIWLQVQRYVTKPCARCGGIFNRLSFVRAAYSFRKTLRIE